MKGPPLSGSEPIFTNNFWGTQLGIGDNNCYDYAVNDYRRYRSQKSSPGNKAGLSNLTNTNLTCPVLKKRVIADNPKRIYQADGDAKCRKQYFKIMMFMAPGKSNNFFSNKDFHFYKQHGIVQYKVKAGDTYKSIAAFFKIPETTVRRAGALVAGKKIVIRANVFSHKQGWATAPLLVDAKGKIIKDPRQASRNYPGLDYSSYCGSFCVKNRGIKVGKT